MVGNGVAAVVGGVATARGPGRFRTPCIDDVTVIPLPKLMAIVPSLVGRRVIVGMHFYLRLARGGRGALEMATMAMIVVCPHQI